MVLKYQFNHLLSVLALIMGFTNVELFDIHFMYGCDGMADNWKVYQTESFELKLQLQNPLVHFKRLFRFHLVSYLNN